MPGQDERKVVKKEERKRRLPEKVKELARDGLKAI